MFDEMAYVEHFLDLLFLAKVVLKFFTGVPFGRVTKMREVPRQDTEFKEVGYINDRKIIATLYLEGTFFFDLLTLVPFFLYPWMEHNSEDWYRLYYLKIFRVIFN